MTKTYIPALEPIAQSLNYGDLPETWRVPYIDRFSTQKTLYDYQTNALKNAARALYLYYGEASGWQPAERQTAGNQRKLDFANRYGNRIDEFSVSRYESNADRINQKQNPVFKILAEYITPWGDVIPYHELINRMCFWMATGSGKTLVMVKIMEYLHRLKQHRKIPPHNILVLAPSDHLIGQIRRTIEEFNESGLHIDFVPLRASGQIRQGRLGDTATVYYHRSDNLSDVQKEALTDYRLYENDGKWYVLLDEAHKGGKEDSKRQAYYALMAREGFLFNFSATFTDPVDIQTTVAKYNLEDFIGGGRGKNIYLNESEYRDFARRQEDIGGQEKRRIVMKSLLTLAFVSRCGRELREKTGRDDLYHRPLMLTLVNSVNTDVQEDGNDLWAFFQTLRGLATGDMDEALFREAKEELKREWGSAQMLIGDDDGGIARASAMLLGKMRITDLREAVFLGRKKSALEYIRSQDNRELVFKMKNTDAPFAMIRIGDTAKWRNRLLEGFEEMKSLDERSFFSTLDENSITILMGSRSFFESWDSNRPNVINFINIGGSEARKFVLQSIGRGVRIEPLPGQRRRWTRLPAAVRREIEAQQVLATPLETLFLFATNRSAIAHVMQGLDAEKTGVFEKVEGFVKSRRPQLRSGQMPLFVPEYQELRSDSGPRVQFGMSKETWRRFRAYLDGASDSLLAVRNGFDLRQIGRLREMVGKDRRGLRDCEDRSYGILPFLVERLKAHLERAEKEAKGVRELDEERDIVHFREIRALPETCEIGDLSDKVREVARGGISKDKKRDLAGQFARGEIGEEEYERRGRGKEKDSYRDLSIKRIASHYYVPVVTAPKDKAEFIQHIIKVPSEVEFLERLQDAFATDGQTWNDWDAWMFSKLDESLDQVHIPYYDSSCDDREFYPDFIFWMCKGNEYRIVFVDPKGTEHTGALRKIDGYKKLFEQSNPKQSNTAKPRKFSYASRWKVSVHLWFFNAQAASAAEYQRYWTDNAARIFER